METNVIVVLLTLLCFALDPAVVLEASERPMTPTDLVAQVWTIRRARPETSPPQRKPESEQDAAQVAVARILAAQTQWKIEQKELDRTTRPSQPPVK